MPNSSALRIGVAVVCSALLLTGCTDSGDDGDKSAPAPAANGATSYPLSIENCGETVTFESAPKRAVSLYQSSTEILLSLGLADRMVGTSTWFDPVLPNLEADNAKVPRLADNDPSFETVLDTEPDLVTSASAHTFTSAVVAERSKFAELGVPTYQSPAVCTDTTVDGENVSRDKPLSIDTLYREITDLAEIFDVQPRGAELVAQLQDRMAKARAAIDSKFATPPTVAFWFSGIRTPYLAGCCAAPGLAASEVGAVNVFADAKDDWPAISWESVADRNPDVLVLGDLSRKRVDGDALDTKIAFLESNPVTQNLDAVRNKRFVVLTGSELDPGIREVDAVEKLAAGLATLDPSK